ncbi:hypothetical protein ABZ312_20120 [Streptomyces sp. NPDC006207]
MNDGGRRVSHPSAPTGARGPGGRAHRGATGREAGTGIPVTLSALAALVLWIQARFSYVRWRRPLRLRIGADGIGMREVSGEEGYFRWPQMATVTIGRRPYGPDLRQCLTVWPLPGTHAGDHPSHLSDGHRAYVLDRWTA